MESAKDRVFGLFSRTASTYDTVGPRHFAYFARRLVEFAAVNRGDRVLDVATGTGAVLVVAAEQVGNTGQVVGVDLVPSMLSRAAAAVRDRGLSNVELRLGEADQLDFEPTTFDVVLCSFGLSSFANKDRALSAFLPVMRPGGRLGLVDTFGWYFQHDPRWHSLESIFHTVGALRTWCPQVDLRTLIARAGFTEVEAVEDMFELVFADEEEWWRWSWSHGTRHLFETVPPPQLEDLQHDLFSALQQCREEDGRIHGQMRATLVRARKPRATAPGA
jgi:ubiquinone/menaquinone biosynthesis C-methylase UbiE